MLISDASSSGIQTSHGIAETHYSALNFQQQRNLVGNTVTCTSLRNVNIFTQSLSFREHKVSKTPICCGDLVFFSGTTYCEVLSGDNLFNHFRPVTIYLLKKQLSDVAVECARLFPNARVLDASVWGIFPKVLTESVVFLVALSGVSQHWITQVEMMSVQTCHEEI